MKIDNSGFKNSIISIINSLEHMNLGNGELSRYSLSDSRFGDLIEFRIMLDVDFLILIHWMRKQYESHYWEHDFLDVTAFYSDPDNGIVCKYSVPDKDVRNILDAPSEWAHYIDLVRLSISKINRFLQISNGNYKFVEEFKLYFSRKKYCGNFRNYINVKYFEDVSLELNIENSCFVANLHNRKKYRIFDLLINIGLARRSSQIHRSAICQKACGLHENLYSEDEIKVNVHHNLNTNISEVVITGVIAGIGAIASFLSIIQSITSFIDSNTQKQIRILMQSEKIILSNMGRFVQECSEIVEYIWDRRTYKTDNQTVYSILEMVDPDKIYSYVTDVSTLNKKGALEKYIRML